MIRIYTLKNCEFCNKVKNYLNENNYNYVDVDVDNDDNYEEVSKLFKYVGAPLLPIVILNNHYIFAPSELPTHGKADGLGFRSQHSS